MFATVLILACGAEPQQFVVENKTVPAFTVTNRVANPDPYGIPDYAYFHQLVAAGIKGVLVVGVEDKYVGTYTYHCWMPSGFGGLADGEYDCFLWNGRPAMERREVAATRPFPSRSTPDTTVHTQGATGASTSSPVAVPYPVRTLTPARPGILGGIENCGPVG